MFFKRINSVGGSWGVFFFGESFVIIFEKFSFFGISCLIFFYFSDG